MSAVLNMPSEEQRRSAPSQKVEPLENGDLLTASEFLRRYEAMPHLKKAELIEGIVYMGSPVRLIHAEPDSLIHMWLSHYSAFTPGCKAAANATIRLDPDNVLQPDALLRIDPEKGGISSVDTEGYLTGPPELIAEITSSQVSIDLRDKLRVYRRAGVREYLVWRTIDSALDWFVLEKDAYVPNVPDAEQIYRSRIFPGLWLDLPALLAQNAARILQVIELGLESPAHAEFKARLNARTQSSDDSRPPAH
jgi:hypothetical protein